MKRATPNARSSTGLFGMVPPNSENLYSPSLWTSLTKSLHNILYLSHKSQDYIFHKEKCSFFTIHSMLLSTLLACTVCLEWSNRSRIRYKRLSTKQGPQEVILEHSLISQQHTKDFKIWFSQLDQGHHLLCTSPMGLQCLNQPPFSQPN